MPLRNLVGGGPGPSHSARAILAVFAVCVAAIGGCVSLRTVDAANVDDLQAEEHYKAVYAGQVARLQADIQLFLPSGSNPGVCNKGGTKQGCYDVDVRVIQTLHAMLAAFGALPVPPRFVEADKLLKDAIAENIRGLELRNQGIAQDDNTAFTEHKVVLERALAGYAKAYQAYPDDNRPQPAP